MQNEKSTFEDQALIDAKKLPLEEKLDLVLEMMFYLPALHYGQLQMAKKHLKLTRRIAAVENAVECVRTDVRNYMGDIVSNKRKGSQPPTTELGIILEQQLIKDVRINNN